MPIPAAGECGEHLSVVRVYRSCDAHRVFLCGAVAKAPQAAAGEVGIRQAGVARELLRPLRCSVRGEVRERRAADELHRADLASDQRFRADVADADREVDALVDNVHRAIGELDLSDNYAEFHNNACLESLFTARAAKTMIDAADVATAARALVIPAQAVVQRLARTPLDSRFRGNDGKLFGRTRPPHKEKFR
ncbi:MAG: hypothetical protein ABI294_08830 [Casimicrobiaceae bacterium]